MNTPKTYDPKVEELARSFLEDSTAPDASSDDNVDALATEIQGTIEDFLSDIESGEAE